MSMWHKWMAPMMATSLLGLAAVAHAQDDPTPSRSDSSASTQGEGDADPSGSPWSSAPSSSAPSSSAPSSSAPSSSADSTSAANDAQDAQFDRELLSVEEQVNSLKERVFRSKATLQLLAEIVAQGSGTGSRASVMHVNHLGHSYKIESLSYYLDGQSRYTRTASEGGLDGVEQIKVFDGPITTGSHNLSVTMQLRGSSGVFNYVDQIGFNVQSNATFEVKDGESCMIRVTADQKKGLTKSFEERPHIGFDVRCDRPMESTGGQ